MRIRCSRCGKSVSTEVPDGTIIRAWVECPECIGKGEEPVSDEMKKCPCTRTGCKFNKKGYCRKRKVDREIKRIKQGNIVDSFACYSFEPDNERRGK